MACSLNINTDIIHGCSACRTFFINDEQVDYSCVKCKKLYCRECLPNIIVRECKFPPFGYDRVISVLSFASE